MNEALERYYTNDMVSSFMISMITCESPQIILDLGVGGASLTKAAFLKWSNAIYFAVDIDSHKIEENKKLLPFCNFLNIDALSKGFVKKLGLGTGIVDIAICNPPYSKFPNVNEVDLAKLIKSANLKSIKDNKHLNTEILFLLYNLSMLKVGGHLGIILPDGIFTNNAYVSLRKDLLCNNDISHVIELPEKTFSKTEAKTHILILKKGTLNKRPNKKVSLLRLNKDGSNSKIIKVKENNLIKRMDYKFHNGTINNQGQSFAKLDVQVFRGNLSYKILRKCTKAYFHTTHFKTLKNREIFFNDYENEIDNSRKAVQGDILMARVGKRIVGEWAIVKSGSAVVSDCVFILKIPEKSRNRVIRYMKSEEFSNDIQILKHGVCSQLISKIDLLNIKIPENL